MSLPTPIGRQREVLYLPAAGHVVVLGTAGSGKTTLAILRAAYLADDATDHGGRTLLVTFNAALVTYLRYLMDRRLRNVTVEHYHLFARGYLNSRGKINRNCICSPEERMKFIEAALSDVRSNNPHSAFDLPVSIFAEEIRFTYQMGFTSLANYQLQPSLASVEPFRDAESRALLWRVQYYARASC